MESPIGRGHIVGEIGLPEVDKLLQGSRFRQLRNNNTLLQTTTTPLEKPHPPPNIFRRCESLSPPSLNRISDLPDGVLEFILSLLPMREAAATSVLSRRWRDLWSVSASCFDFDLPNMTGNYSLNLRALFRDKELLKRERPRFMGWIEDLLRMRTHCSSSVQALRISFIMGKESALKLNRWVTYAARHALRELQLDFDYCTSIETAYDFPHQSFPCLQYLRLTGCNFSYPPDFGGFKSLISLTLIDTFFSTTDTLQNILSNCSSLECLSLFHCLYFFRSADSFTLNFSGPSLRLKHLRLHFMTQADIRKVEVHNVNLLSLELYGFHTQLSIKNTPHLARLVACTGTPVDIHGDLPRLQTLFVTAKSWVKETILPNLSTLKNLRRLVFLANGDTTHLLEVIRLLEACPLLHKLELDVGLSSRVLTQGLTSTTKERRTLYTNLKEVEIFGFQDHPEKIELAIHLLKNAVVLERMDIFHISRKYIGDAQWILYVDASPETSTEAAAKETQVLLNKVGKELQKEARPSTKLVIHPGNYTYLP